MHTTSPTVTDYAHPTCLLNEPFSPHPLVASGILLHVPFCLFQARKAFGRGETNSTTGAGGHERRRRIHDLAQDMKSPGTGELQR